MLRLVQIYKTIDNKELFINLFNNLDFELTVLGFNKAPELLMEDLLMNHFGIEFTDDKQLKDFTIDVLKYQNRLSILTSL